jgi:4-amino-4-deoxy-L-arabinose transferase-like glycosyltransferase
MRNGPLTGQGSGALRLRKLDWLLLGIVLAVGIFFRLYRQGQLPPGMTFDEAFESLQARRILTEPGYHPVFFPDNNGVPPIKIYLTAAAFVIGGEDRLAIRYGSAVIGILTILALYVLVRALFPVKVREGRDDNAAPDSEPSAILRRWLPLVACLIMAVLPWHVSFSRQGLEVILLPLWATLAVFFLWQGLETLTWGSFALSGLFWGSVFYTYQAAWLLPGVLVLFLIYKLIQERGFLRLYAGRLALLALVASLVLLPLIRFAHQNPGVFIHRTDQVALFGKGQGSDTPLASLAGNTWKVARLFVLGGDTSNSDNIPLRPPLPLPLALAFVIGCAVALRRFRRPAYALLLIWLVWMAVPSIVTQDAPSIRRAVGSVPPMIILIVLGLGWAFDGLVRWVGPRRKGQAWAYRAGGLALCALLIYCVAWGYHYYFVDWAQVKDTFHYFNVGLVQTGQYAASTPADTRLYYTPAGQGNIVHLPLAWPIRDRDLRTFDGGAGLVLPPAGPQASLYMVTTFQADATTLPALHDIYPTGQVVYQAHDLHGVPDQLAYAVPAGTEPSLSIQNRLTANLEDQATLLGSNLSATQVRPGDPLVLTLFWQATAGPSKLNHTVFTHLLGPVNAATGGTLWAGNDGQPVGGSYPTVRWARGEIIVDRHTFAVPEDAPVGVYKIETGLYTPEQGGARLKVLDAAGHAQGDSVLVGEVHVTAK